MSLETVASGKEYIMIYLVNDVEGNFRGLYKLGVEEGIEREKYFPWMRFMSQEIDSLGKNFFSFCSLNPDRLKAFRKLRKQIIFTFYAFAVLLTVSP